MKYTGAEVRVKKVPSLPSLVKLNVNTLIIGAYKASENETITINIKNWMIFMPKNIGIGPRVAIEVPARINVYGG